MLGPACCMRSGCVRHCIGASHCKLGLFLLLTCDLLSLLSTYSDKFGTSSSLFPTRSELAGAGAAESPGIAIWGSAMLVTATWQPEGLERRSVAIPVYQATVCAGQKGMCCLLPAGFAPATGQLKVAGATTPTPPPHILGGTQHLNYTDFLNRHTGHACFTRAARQGTGAAKAWRSLHSADLAVRGTMRPGPGSAVPGCQAETGWVHGAGSTETHLVIAFTQRHGARALAQRYRQEAKDEVLRWRLSECRGSHTKTPQSTSRG